MTFETADGRAAWHAAEVSHDQWTDWTDWFASAVAPKFVVSQQLAKLRALHAPTEATYLVIDEQGPKVDFALETGEDTFRDFSGTIAALLRAAARHGARGTFYFLGTAGAERDFTYKLELANGESTIESLHPDEVAMIYEGEEYQAFLRRVMEALGISAEGEQVSPASAQPTAGRNPFVAPVPVAEDDTDDTEEEAEALPTKPARQPATTTVKKKPAAKQPVARTAAKTVKKPAAKKPVVKKPAAKKPAAKKPAAKATKKKR